MKGTIFTWLLVAFGTVASIPRPAVGLFLYIAFSLLRPQWMWGWAQGIFSVSMIVGVAMLVGWVLHGFGSWRFGRGRAMVVAALFFLGWSGVSTLQAINMSVSAAMLVEFLKIVLPFLVGVTMLKTEKDVRTLLWVIVAVQGFVGYEMNSLYFSGTNVPFDIGFGGMDNNSFGISLVTTFGLSVVLGLAAKTWRAKAVAAVCAAFILHTILLTFSRGAFVGLIAVGVVAIVIMPKRPKYIGAVVGVAMLAAWLTGPELSARYGTTFAEQRDASAESRLELWQDCLTVVASRPLLGVGPRNFPLISSEFGWPAGKEAHSVWFQTAAEIGVPGVSALILFYALTVARLWPLARRRDSAKMSETAMMATGIILSIIGYVVSAQFVSLQGLEVPVYVAMAGVVLLKSQSAPAGRNEAARPADASSVRPAAGRGITASLDVAALKQGRQDRRSSG